jgi:hypothetical protein
VRRRPGRPGPRSPLPAQLRSCCSKLSHLRPARQPHPLPPHLARPTFSPPPLQGLPLPQGGAGGARAGAHQRGAGDQGGAPRWQQHTCVHAPRNAAQQRQARPAGRAGGKDKRGGRLTRPGAAAPRRVRLQVSSKSRHAKVGGALAARVREHANVTITAVSRGPPAACPACPWHQAGAAALQSPGGCCSLGRHASRELRRRRRRRRWASTR